MASSDPLTIDKSPNEKETASQVDADDAVNTVEPVDFIRYRECPTAQQ